MKKFMKTITKPFGNKKAGMEIEDQAIEKSGNKGMLVIVIVLMVGLVGFAAPKVKGYITEMKSSNATIDSAINAAK